jgi:hypothetical protein
MTKVSAPTAARSWAFVDSGSTVMASGRARVRSVDTTSPRPTTATVAAEAATEKRWAFGSILSVINAARAVPRERLGGVR